MFNGKNLIYRTIIVTIVTTILVTPIATSLTEFTKTYIDTIFDDDELKDLTKEKLKTYSHIKRRMK